MIEVFDTSTDYAKLVNETAELLLRIEMATNLKPEKDEKFNTFIMRVINNGKYKY